MSKLCTILYVHRWLSLWGILVSYLCKLHATCKFKEYHLFVFCGREQDEPGLTVSCIAGWIVSILSRMKGCFLLSETNSNMSVTKCWLPCYKCISTCLDWAVSLISDQLILCQSDVIHSPKFVPIKIIIPSWAPTLGWNSKSSRDLNWNSKLNGWSIGRV